jgi:hypothetical protein
VVSREPRCTTLAPRLEPSTIANSRGTHEQEEGHLTRKGTLRGCEGIAQVVACDCTGKDKRDQLDEDFELRTHQMRHEPVNAAKRADGRAWNHHVLPVSWPAPQEHPKPQRNRSGDLPR